MDKAKKTNIEEAFCEYLAKNFRGANNPVSSKTLETIFHVKGTEIRKMVNSLRCKGEPICSDLDGYYYHVVKPNASKAKDVIEITLKWIKNILQIN